jgi:two-component system, chemotaxis family, response regulator Rcp1
MSTAVPPIEILLVEDNPADVRLTWEALKETETRSHLHVIEDGVKALSFLRGEGDDEGRPKPDLILLDLNLPKKDGWEVLDEIKRDNALKHIPVIILTTSQAEQDILRSYQLCASAYIAKPVDVGQFFKAVKLIDAFWLGIVKLARP